MFRFLKYAAIGVMLAGLIAVPFFVSTGQSSMVAVIVEFRDDPATVYAAKAKQQGSAVTDSQIRAYRDQLTVAQNQFLDGLKNSGITFQLQSVDVKGYDGNVAGNVQLRYSLVFNGVALNVPASAVPVIESLPQVKKVHPDAPLYPDLVKSVNYLRANELYGKNPNDFTPFANFPDGDEGQGIYIAVIDTGIDWTHPMFGGDPTPPRLGISPNAAAVPSNQKVVYSLPLTDIVTDGFGHGTHVASEAAGYLAIAPGSDGIPGTSDDVAIHGVAPQAKLMSYKVCSDIQSTVSQVQPIGGCSTSNIVMSIEDAVSPQTVDLQPKPIANVINMSLGGGGGPDNPTAIASDNATLAGCVVVAAAGNSGPGEATVGSPAAGKRVIAAAATTDPGSGANWSADVLSASSISTTKIGAVTPANNLPLATGQRSQIILFPMAGTPTPPAGSEAQYVVFVRNGQTLDEFPANVSGRIALVKTTNPRVTGTTLFAQVANNAAAAGAIGVLFSAATQNPTALKATIPGANIGPDDALYLESLMPGFQPATDKDHPAVDPANGAMSSFPIRLNPFFGTSFIGQMAGFSSRGPVRGWGQIKPDVSAPGVNILAAVPPASVIAALGVEAQGVNYAKISGTSMATPHTTGSVALVRQAHPDWTPDMVRTAMINSATNLRDENKNPKPDGLDADPILAQGGGLVDVFHAVKIKALMGIAGDGIAQPSILGSYSYGLVPVANNRVTSTQSVTVTIQDVTGQGGTYNLGVANNRDLQLNGINVSTSAASVTVPANGSATFTVNATFDGNLNRDPNTVEAVVSGTSVNFVPRPIQMQWYVNAQRSDGTDNIHMPFYFKPVPSIPANGTTATQTFTGTVLAGDNNRRAAAGVDFVEVPFTVDDRTYRIDAQMSFNQTAGSVTDLDFFLVDPDGKIIASSSTLDNNPESLGILVFRPGTYKYQVTGFQNGPTNFTITSNLSKAPIGPALQTIPGDFVNAAGNHVDFDGTFTINWTPQGGEQGFEVEQSADDKDKDGNPIPNSHENNWQIVTDVGAGTTSFSFTGLAQGSYFFRVRGIFPGQIGQFVSNAGNTTSVVVDPRTKVDITTQVSQAISNLSLAGGVFQLDLNLTNNSTQTYLPLVDLNVVGISSASGTVKVINADNGKTGTSLANAALFGYSQQLGPEQQFSPNEVTGARTMRFQDSASELFTFDAVVTAYVGSAGSSSSSAATTGGTSSSGTSASDPGALLNQLTAVMRFTANPLTNTVTVQLVSLK